MANEIENLTQAVAEWREQKSQYTPPPKAKNPYGPKIHEANMKWAEARKAALEKIKAEEVEYHEEKAKWEKLHAQWEAENRAQNASAAKRGPKRTEHSPEVKKAAAAALRAGLRKSLIRAVLSVNTVRLNEILRDGEELLQAEQSPVNVLKDDGEDW